MNMKIVTHARVAVLAAATGLLSGCGREEVSATSSADQPKETITAIEKMSPSLAERIKTLADIRKAANIASCNAWLGGDVADTRTTSSFNDQLPEHALPLHGRRNSLHELEQSRPPCVRFGEG
jgi:hypothetical protein